jgi:hypothetical protein
MAKFRYEWCLFDFKDGLPDVISKPFKTKAAAEEARGKYPPKMRGGIGVGIREAPANKAKRRRSG